MASDHGSVPRRLREDRFVTLGSLLECDREVKGTAFGLPKTLSFILMANASWDSSSRINCHHIAARLSNEHRVLFVESIGVRRPSLASRRDLGKVLRRLQSAVRGIRRCSPNLTVLSPLLVPGLENAGVNALNARLLEFQIGIATADWPDASPHALWTFTPAFGPAAARLNSALRVYQCVDEHAAYPGAPECMDSLEEALMARSDVILTTSRPLFESRKAMHPNVVCLPNVADTDLFERAQDGSVQVPQDLIDIRRPIIGFVGNISAFKIDPVLLRRVADINPDMSFVLIGEVGLGESTTSLEPLDGVRNIHLLGPRPYKDLPRYLKGFDVCMIPFVVNGVTTKCLPMKLFEYMASGKPIVATATPPLVEYADQCYLARDHEEFSSALQRALEEPSRGREAYQRIRTARAHGWSEQVRQLGRILGDAWGIRNRQVPA